MPGKFMRMATALLALFIYCSCSKTTDVAVKAPETTKVPDSTIVPENKVDRTSLLQLVNGLRTRGCKCGTDQMPPVPAVTWNGLLEKAAYGHSKDMTLRNYFDHNSPDGTTPGVRLDAVGYHWSFYGENIAAGNMDEQAVILGWLSSPKHCHNMMDPRFAEFGVGKYDNNWTMELGSRPASRN